MLHSSAAARDRGHFWSQGKNKLMVQAAPPQVYSGLGYLVHGLVDPSLFHHLRDTSIVINVRLLHNDTMSNRNDFGSCLSLLPNTKSRRWLHELLYGWGRIDRRTDGRGRRLDLPTPQTTKNFFSTSTGHKERTEGRGEKFPKRPSQHNPKRTHRRKSLLHDNKTRRRTLKS